MKKYYLLHLLCFFPFLMGSAVTQAQHTQNAEDTEIVFLQDVNPMNGAVSSIGMDDKGYLSAEDFELDKDYEISQFKFQGYQMEDNLEDILSGIALYIFNDADGIPDGIPNQSGEPLYTLELTADDAHLTLNKTADYEYEFLVDTPDLPLEANTRYWVVFAPIVDFSAGEFDLDEVWNWYTSSSYNYSDAVNIDRDDVMGYGMTYWISLTDMTGGIFEDELNGLYLSIAAEKDMGTDILDEKSLSIYPNPVKSDLTVSANQKIDGLIIYNDLGQIVKQLSPNIDRIQIDLENLPSGIYFMKTTIDGSVENTKLIKE